MEMKIDILQELCKKDAVQTELSNKLNINSKTIKPCLLALRANGLISKEWMAISITAKGRKILEMAQRIKEKLQSTAHE
jgi:predicted transcriptional regulator